jgi:hypothetical protein
MFQLKLVTIKREMEQLKSKVNSAVFGGSSGKSGSHQLQHWNHILSYLQKKTTEQIECFQVFLPSLSFLILFLEFNENSRRKCPTKGESSPPLWSRQCNWLAGIEE